MSPEPLVSARPVSLALLVLLALGTSGLGTACRQAKGPPAAQQRVEPDPCTRYFDVFFRCQVQPDPERAKAWEEEKAQRIDACREILATPADARRADSERFVACGRIDDCAGFDRCLNR
jgi:hypothetical protein